MRKFILCLTVAGFTLTLCPGSMAQSRSPRTTLFEYGKSVTTGEDNLKNLFENFPKVVQNPEVVDLLSYKYVGTVESRKQVKGFLKKNINSQMPMWNISTSSGGTINGEPIPTTPEITLFPIENNLTKDDIRSLIDLLADEYIKAGDSIYVVRFVSGMRSYDYYIFINAATGKVVTKFNIFGFGV